MQGTIKSVRKNKKGFQLVEDEQWYGNPKGPAFDWFDRGLKVEFEFKSEGGWNNYLPETVKQVGGAPAGGGNFSGGGRKWHAYEDKDYQAGINKRIVRQNALTNACNLFAKQVSPDTQFTPELATSITNMAEFFVEWVESGDE